jgi:peptide/nickel transport system substrate-binding protein
MLRAAGPNPPPRIGRGSHSASRAAGVLVATLALTLFGAQGLAAPPKGGAANLAMIGEPQTLDPMASTADLVSIIMQHVYEPLYTFDGNWNVAPMLAESMPAISKDGLTYTIPLRKGVKFHNGKARTPS